MPLRETHREYEARTGTGRPTWHYHRALGRVLCGAYASGDFSSSSIRAANCQACIREFELLGPVWAAIGDYQLRAIERDRPVLPAREALEATIWVYAHALAQHQND